MRSMVVSSKSNRLKRLFLQSPMKKYILYAFLALTVAGILFGLWSWLKPTTVEVTTPTRGPVVDAVYASGTVEPEVMYPVAPRVTARLTQLLADEGDTVAPGQILAQLEASDLNANLLELKAREANAKAQFEREQRLLPQGGTSQAAFDTAQADYRAALQARKASEAQVGYSQLTALVTSTVVYREGEVGQLIPANQTVFWLAEPGNLRVSVQVDEEDIPQVQLNQRVLMRSDAFPGKSFEGRVSSITPKGDAEARSFRVRVGLPSDIPFRIGMTVETNIILRTETNALLIPTSAASSGKVWKVVDGKAQPHTITTGVITTSQTEVLSGLTPSETVIVTPPENLKAGDKIHAVTR